jgi:ABC-type multidrug transport system ATPase subunit
MQVGDQFPIEDVGLSKGDGPAVVYFYAQAGTDGRILQKVSIEVGQGELVCLLGGNASGNPRR